MQEMTNVFMLCYNPAHSNHCDVGKVLRSKNWKKMKFDILALKINGASKSKHKTKVGGCKTKNRPFSNRKSFDFILIRSFKNFGSIWINVLNRLSIFIRFPIQTKKLFLIIINKYEWNNKNNVNKNEIIYMPVFYLHK